MQLNQVTAAVTDYDAAVAFYKALGLQLIVASPPRYARFECPATVEQGEPATFSISTDYGPPVRTPAPICYFEAKDMDARVAAMAAAGARILAPPEDKSWGWREADIADPDGNVIRLYWAGPNRRFPAWRVTSSRLNKQPKKAPAPSAEPRPRRDRVRPPRG